MIIKNNEGSEILRENVFGGEGHVKGLGKLSSEDFGDKLKFLNVFTLEKGCSVGYHQHLEDAEVYYILQGNCIVMDNDLVEELTAGDLIYTKPGEFHSIRNNGEGDVKFLAFVIN